MVSYSEWLKNQTLTEQTYYTLPEDVIGNDFYVLQKDIAEMYKSLKSGSDLNMKYWQDIKKLVSKIDKSIKKENS